MQSTSCDANSELRANCYECAFRLIHRYFGGNPHVCKIPEPVWDKFASLLTPKSKVTPCPWLSVHAELRWLSHRSRLDRGQESW